MIRRIWHIRCLSFYNCLHWHRCYRCQTHYAICNRNRYHETDEIPPIWYSTFLSPLSHCLIPFHHFCHALCLTFNFFSSIFFGFDVKPSSFALHIVKTYRRSGTESHTLPHSAQMMWLLFSRMHPTIGIWHNTIIRLFEIPVPSINASHCCAHHFTQTNTKQKPEATK